MPGHSIQPQPQPQPRARLSWVTVSVRMLAQPSVVGIAFPGMEPGWGQSQGARTALGHSAARQGCQWRAGSTRGVPNCVWLLLVFVGALSCPMPSLGYTGTGCWHWHLPDSHVTEHWGYPSVPVVRVGVPPSLSAPPCFGVSILSCSSWKDAAASPGYLWPLPRSINGVLEREGLSRSILHPVCVKGRIKQDLA